jgi:hypothetical protein
MHCSGIAIENFSKCLHFLYKKICKAPIELLIVIISYKNSFKCRLHSVPMPEAMARSRTIVSDSVKSIYSGDTVHVRYLIPWNRFFLEKLIVTQLIKKYPTSYRTKILIYCLNSSLNSFWATQLQSAPSYNILFFKIWFPIILQSTPMSPKQIKTTMHLAFLEVKFCVPSNRICLCLYIIIFEEFAPWNVKPCSSADYTRPHTHLLSRCSATT